MQVKFFPNQPHCFAFGGFEIQMLRTMEAINCIEPCVGKIDVWEKEDKFNIAHFWGLGINQYDSVTWAKKTKKLVVLTALLSYLDASKDKLENHFSQLCGRAKYEKRIIKNIDALVVVNELQANIAQKYFKCPSDKIHIIPNVVSQKYWMKKNNKFSDLCKLKDYVLTTGNICRRKNQINLALACIKKQYNLVIIGNVLSGEDDYGKELKKIVENNENIFWIKGLDSESDLLVSAYHDCKLFALPSFGEQQPISALEAGICGKPILLGNHPYARQKYYKMGRLVDPSSIENIAYGLEDIFANPSYFIPPTEYLIECKEENVGRAYITIYSKLVKENAKD